MVQSASNRSRAVMPSEVEIRDFSQLSKRASASLDGDSPREQEKSRISGD